VIDEQRVKRQLVQMNREFQKEMGLVVEEEKPKPPEEPVWAGLSFAKRQVASEVGRREHPPQVLGGSLEGLAQAAFTTAAIITSGPPSYS